MKSHEAYTNKAMASRQKIAPLAPTMAPFLPNYRPPQTLYRPRPSDFRVAFQRAQLVKF